MDLKSLNNPGLNLPLANDSAAGKPSVTLLLMYVANLIAIISLIYLHIKGDPLAASGMTCLYAVICTVLYMMRKLNKASFDLKSQKFEVDGGEDEKKSN
jgi:hypothetical protein